MPVEGEMVSQFAPATVAVNGTGAPEVVMSTLPPVKAPRPATWLSRNTPGERLTTLGDTINWTFTSTSWLPLVGCTVMVPRYVPGVSDCGLMLTGKVLRASPKAGPVGEPTVSQSTRSEEH